MKRAMSVLSVCLAAGIVIGAAYAQQDKSKPATPAPTPAAKPPATPAPSTPAKPAAAAPEMKLPAGWTPEDMKKMADAGTPGPMHAMLAKHVGTWKGQASMWMAPDTDAVKSEVTMTCTSLMDGRFTQVQMKGETPMGPMDGLALYGYDNVAKKFQSTWVTNCGTSMMVGTGELASDGSTINWSYTSSCPIAQKTCSMREIEKIVNENTISFQTFGADPKSGKEFKMYEVTLTRTGK